jgi:hypothetical protein
MALVGDGAFSIQPSSEWVFEVSDPTKVVTGYTSHTEYTIGITHDRQQYQIQRRYSDFIWLQGVLKDTYLGVVIPPLPAEGVKNKAVALLSKAGNQRVDVALLGEKTCGSFLSRRQGGMQLFMARMSAHGELSQSEIWTKFIAVYPLDSYKKQLKEAENARKGSSLSRASKWFGKKKQQFVESNAGQQAAENGLIKEAGGNVSQEDEMFNQVLARLRQFQRPAEQLKLRTANLSAHSNGITDDFRDLSSLMIECASVPTMGANAKWAPAFEVLVRKEFTPTALNCD